MNGKVQLYKSGMLSKMSSDGLVVISVAAPADAVAGFDDMISGTQRKYYLLGGKGGVGKTSCAASLAVKFAHSGHPTLVVSTDPAHSLSDSFVQDLSGGSLVPVDRLDYPLFALELNSEKAREEFRSASKSSGGTGVKDFMDGMGLRMIVEQLGELNLGELLDTPPPGLDEAIAISKDSFVGDAKQQSSREHDIEMGNWVPMSNSNLGMEAFNKQIQEVEKLVDKVSGLLKKLKLEVVGPGGPPDGHGDDDHH